jgi:hypothetical protein
LLLSVDLCLQGKKNTEFGQLILLLVIVLISWDLKVLIGVVINDRLQPMMKKKQKKNSGIEVQRGDDDDAETLMTMQEL